jgi:Zn-finger nucleic acid-binding protein
MSTFKLCPICDNMLYIKVSNENEYTDYCKNCSYQEISVSTESKVIINSFYDNNEDFSAYVNKHIKYDPTIPRVNNIKCQNKKCSKKEDEDNKVMIIKYDNINLKYIYLCCYCDNYWNNDNISIKGELK